MGSRARAAQAVDVGFMLLGLVGIESARLAQTAPKLVVTAGVWTHSIPATIVWSVGCGLAAGLWWRKRSVGIAVGGLVVLQTLSEFVIPTPPTFGELAATALGLYGAVTAWCWHAEAR